MLLLNTLDWLLIALSLFNTIAMLWLGLTVLINAERRSWGTWAAGGGLLLGGIFFLGHTAVVGRVLGTFSNEMEFWWLLGWLVLPGAPYLWYTVMAWYSGAIRGRVHRVLVIAMGCLGLLAIASLLLGNPLPSYQEVLRNGRGIIASGPWNLALLYPLYSVGCIVLALIALRNPAPSERFMGDLARRRARPWLIAASFALLAVSLAVGGAAALFLELARLGDLPPINMLSLGVVIAFDLVITGFIAAAIVLIGQAVVAYEIFTGGALPSGALARRWRRSLIFAAGYGLVLGWAMSGAGGPVEPIYQVLLGLLVSVVFVALLGWRSDAERERTVERLRPFVSSQHVYEQLLDPAQPADERLAIAPFQAIVVDLLGAERAYLLPLGPLEPLIGTGFAVPPTEALPTLASNWPLPEPATLCVPLVPTDYGGAVWAVPLWGERGLIGALLLGPKRNGSLYTREELEVARAASERLLDSQASAEIARRLVALQRRRLAESQVLDRRARRVLHDEVLPEIHAALLQIAERAPAASELQPAIANLQSAHSGIANLLKELPAAPSTDVARVGLLGALRGGVAEFATSFDNIEWQIDPAGEHASHLLNPLNAEVIFYAAREGVRNAARYGRGSEPGKSLRLCIHLALRKEQNEPQLELCIEDDGVGLDSARASGTTPARGLGGSGRGLALHGTMMAIIGGTLSIESSPGQYTRLRLSAPVR
jgi:signal transduction histidine kinase